mgnify:CR=1 FL=1
MKWPTVELGNICSVVTKGTTPRTLGREYVPEGIPFLRAENLLGEEVILGPSTLYIDHTTNQLLARSIIKPDDVLISIAGTIGRCAVVPRNMPEMNCNQAVAIVRISGPLNCRFFLHWLKTSDAQSQMSGAKVTQTISNLSLHQIKKLVVPLPSTSEQHRISEILDQADTLRKKRDVADDKINRMLIAIFYNMFGDPATNPMGWKIGQMGDIILDTRNGLYKPAKYYGTGVGILKMFNIQNGDLNLSRIDLIDVTESEFDAYKLISGDILINRVNTPELVGKCAVITDDIGQAVFESKNIRMRVDSERVTPEYVTAYLNCPFGHSSLRRGVKHAIGMATINNTDLRKTSIPLPPIEIQHQWSKVLNDLKLLKKSALKTKENIASLYQSLLFKAFAGKLTAKWREANMKELIAEMELQAKALEGN